jgi:hypothetical protein
MFSELISHFLFRCNDCNTIYDLELEEPEDLEKVRDGKMELDCAGCNGKCSVLRD